MAVLWCGQRDQWLFCGVVNVTSGAQRDQWLFCGGVALTSDCSPVLSVVLIEALISDFRGRFYFVVLRLDQLLFL